ncbi:hypothetical protein XPA_007941 [Xanthoria parietina]
MQGIYRPMISTCTNQFASWQNAGSVNLKTMPGATSTGEAVDAMYPSYVIAPQALTTSPYGQYAYGYVPPSGSATLSRRSSSEGAPSKTFHKTQTTVLGMISMQNVYSLLCPVLYIFGDGAQNHIVGLAGLYTNVVPHIERRKSL